MMTREIPSKWVRVWVMGGGDQGDVDKGNPK